MNFQWIEYGFDYIQQAETPIGFYSIIEDEDSAGGRVLLVFHQNKDEIFCKSSKELFSGYEDDFVLMEVAKKHFKELQNESTENQE